MTGSNGVDGQTSKDLPSDCHHHAGPTTEDEDYERVVQKMLEQDFDDWPNEAGVSSYGTSYLIHCY